MYQKIEYSLGILSCSSISFMFRGKFILICKDFENILLWCKTVTEVMGDELTLCPAGVGAL